MDEKKPSSSWDDLLQQIGASPAPDALERKRPAIETRFEPPPSAPTPKKRPGDWNALAGALGVDVPEIEEPPRKSSHRAMAGEEMGPSNEALEASFAEIEPMESEFAEIIEEELTDVEFAEADDDFGGEIPTGEGEDSDTLSGEAARNAFESLFQAGSFSALPPIEKPPRRPEGRPGPQWRELEERSRRSVEKRASEERVESDEADEGPRDRDSSEEREGPPRRRRRRRGRGRGDRQEERPARRESGEGVGAGSERSDDEEPADDLIAGEDTVEELEANERPPRRGPRRGRGGRAASAGERQGSSAVRNGRSAESPETDDDELEESPLESALDEDGDDDEDDVKRGSHKNIPTWSEAIGVMVETNLQSRKNSPQRPGPSRERGRARGPGRGGRGRRP